MASHSLVVLWLAAVFLFATASCAMAEAEGVGQESFPMCPMERIRLRETAREMFYHAYGNYMLHAYPADELKPLSCKPRYRTVENSRGHMDDVLGNYSLTLVDSMDTLAVMGDYEEFEKASKLVGKDVHFGRDVTVNLFESTIRMLGGLLSAHQMAEQLRSECVAGGGAMSDYRNEMMKELALFYADRDCFLSDYDGLLLRQALDLGLRLLPAFQTTTGIPYSKVNLLRGLPATIDSKTCLAGAGTLLLEFGTLSRLSGYSIFESVARKAMTALVNRRSAMDLLPGMIDVQSGSWLENVAGIGAGSDSFYEYMYKSHILFGDSALYSDFLDVYNAVIKHMGNDHHYHRVDSRTGRARYQSVDSLQAFWPGFQVLVGDVDKAIENHNSYYKIWRQLGFIPEVYYPVHKSLDARNDDYPLRPEFVESTYFLQRATQRGFYHRVGEHIIANLQAGTRVACGFASYSLHDKKLDDRMDSYFLTETVKYLYLLFDEDNWLERGNFVFTTEGHPLSVVRVKDPSEPVVPGSCKPVSDEAHKRISDLDELMFSAGPFARDGERKPYPEEEDSEEAMAEAVPEDLYNASVISDYAKVYLRHNSWLGAAGGAVKEETILGSWGSFGRRPLRKDAEEGGLQVMEPVSGCTPLVGSSMTGNIAIAVRGECNFVYKARHAYRAGAVALLIADFQGEIGSPFAVSMSGDSVDDVEIAVALVSYEDGEKLAKAAQAGGAVAQVCQGESPIVLLDMDLEAIDPSQQDELVRQIQAALSQGHLTKAAAQEPLMVVDIAGSEEAVVAADDDEACHQGARSSHP